MRCWVLLKGLAQVHLQGGVGGRIPGQSLQRRDGIHHLPDAARVGPLLVGIAHRGQRANALGAPSETSVALPGSEHVVSLLAGLHEVLFLELGLGRTRGLDQLTVGEDLVRARLRRVRCRDEREQHNERDVKNSLELQTLLSTWTQELPKWFHSRRSFPTNLAGYVLTRGINAHLP
jgi:hypothetical protein